MRIWDGKSRIRDGNKSIPGWKKVGSGMEKVGSGTGKKVGSGIRDKHPGSATQLVPTLDGDGDDEDADGGADEGAGVAHRQQAFALDELGHLGGEVAQVRLHVVLQDQARQRPQDGRKKIML